MGAVTSEDVLTAYAAGRNAKATRVRDLTASKDLLTVDPKTPLFPLLLWMASSNTPLLLLEAEGAPAGVLSLRGMWERLVPLLSDRGERARA